MRIGSFTAFLASTSERKEPLKCFGSVRTDKPTAPPFSMLSAMRLASTFFLMVPAEGDAALISVMTGAFFASRIACFRLMVEMTAAFTAFS